MNETLIGIKMENSELNKNRRGSVTIHVGRTISKKRKRAKPDNFLVVKSQPCSKGNDNDKTTIYLRSAIPR